MTTVTSSNRRQEHSGQAAIVGVGATPYYRRGMSYPQTQLELGCQAILSALADAGLTVRDVDGTAYYSGGLDTSKLAQILGIPEITFTASLTGTGGGGPGAVGLAATAVVSGAASVVVTVASIQSGDTGRYSRGLASDSEGGVPHTTGAGAERDFVGSPQGIIGPGQLFALMAQRHMYKYGTKREHLAEVAIAQRQNALRRETALMKKPLTLDDYFAGPMISDPLCLFDFCLESDAAVAVVTTSAERARDLRQPGVTVAAAAQGGPGAWGQGIMWLGMPDDLFTNGQRSIAERVYRLADVGAGDIDVALIYDHFSSSVLTQLEDYGFCATGESGPFVADGNIRWPTGTVPVNTHGGHLSEGYVMGMSHILEAVEQLRGSAVNQVENAQHALVTGGPAPIPNSAMILRRGV